MRAQDLEESLETKLVQKRQLEVSGAAEVVGVISPECITTVACGSDSWVRVAASKPSSRGIAMSSSTTSGRNARASSTASAPSAASADDFDLRDLSEADTKKVPKRFVVVSEETRRAAGLSTPGVKQSDGRGPSDPASLVHRGRRLG